MRRPRARLIVARSSLALQVRSAVALSCLAALLAHSAGLREQLGPPWAPSIAVQRSLKARESLRARMHLPVEVLSEARSAAVDSYPPLERFAAG